MKLSTIKIENFRCFAEETIFLNDYTCLVGANGSGKSTVLAALRIFFGDIPGATGDLQRLQKDDFHNRDTTEDVVITLTFSDLEPEAEEEFKHYARQGELVVSAVASWNESLNAAEVKRFGERRVMKAFGEYFIAEKKANAPELRAIYTKIRESFQDLPPAGTKEAMRNALNEYESNHAEQCELGRSEDLFYGISRGQDRLDGFIKWILVPAVKDASTEELEAKKNAIGMLLERTVKAKTSFAEKIAALLVQVTNSYEGILSENQDALKSLSDSLTTKLREWAHPDVLLSLMWRNDPSKNISIQSPQAEVRAGERLFQGASLSHFGHGLQRSFLLALLQELAGCGDTGNPRLLLACEEPELYQHPPQARHLSSVLQKLSDTNSQVIVSTHSPHFIPGRGFEDVRILRQDAVDAQPCVRQSTIEDIAALLAEARGEKIPIPTGVELKIEQALQPVLNEMFFANVLVLVEGLEDIGYVASYLTLSNQFDEFRRLGCHMVPTSGKGNMLYPLAIAKSLEIPTFIVFDSDDDKMSKADQRSKHEKDNTAILRLCGIAKPNPFPGAVFATESVVMWPRDIGDAVREEIGQARWESLENEVRKQYALVGAPDLEKNPLFIGYVLAAAQAKNIPSKVLELLCNRIISFAREVRAASTALNPEPAEAASP